jgi:hypothetical protein
METIKYIDDEKLAINTAEECLKIVNGDIETYINAVLNNFISNNKLSLSFLKDRVRIYYFLTCMHKEFNDYDMFKYMLNDKYLDRASFCKDIISNIIIDFKTKGL